MILSSRWPHRTTTRSSLCTVSDLLLSNRGLITLMLPQYVFHPAFIHVLLSFISRCQVVWAGLPGQESGDSLADVLYGDWNPSGRLPYTIAKKQEDYPAQIALGGGPLDVLN